MTRRRGSAGVELDMVPVMNLVTILIPFLLFSATFVSLSTIDTVAPEISAERVAEDKETAGVKLRITDAGYYLQTDAPTLSEGLELPCPSQHCSSITDYDNDRLRRALTRIKLEWPDDDRLVLSAEADLSYEALVGAMDAVRESEAGNSLFPAVVIAGG